MTQKYRKYYGGRRPRRRPSSRSSSSESSNSGYMGSDESLSSRRSLSGYMGSDERTSSDRLSSKRKSIAAKKLQNRRRTQVAKRVLNQLKSDKRKNSATKKLQKQFREKKAKQVFKQQRSATKKLQKHFRGKRSRRNVVPIKQQKSAERREKLGDINDLLNIAKKTKVNYETKLERGNFARINLEDKNLSQKKLHNVNLAYANLKNASLIGTKFNGSNLTGANLSKARIKNTKFINTRLNNANLFLIRESTNTNFTDANLTNTNMSDNLFTKTNFNDAIIKKTNFIRSRFTSIEFSTLMSEANFQNGYFMACDFKGQTINCNFKNSRFINCIFQNSYIENSNFENSTFDGCSSSNRSEFNDCNFTNITSKRHRFESTQFLSSIFNDAKIQFGHISSTLFDNCQMNRTHMGANHFHLVRFEGCDLLNADFGSFGGQGNTTDFDESQFIDSNLRNVNFNINMLHNMNFNNMMLDGANFTGSELQGSTFVNASLLGTNFYWTDLNGTDFTDAVLNEHTNFTDARGIEDNTRGLEARLNVGRAVDTHQAFQNLNMNMLFTFFEEHRIECNDYPQNTEEAINKLKQQLSDLINELEEDDVDEIASLKENLNRCFTDAINRFQHFMSPANANTDKTISQMIFCALKYVLKQPDYFKKMYINALVTDILQAHGATGTSCPKGAVERIVTYIANAGHSFIMQYDTDDAMTDKVAEYRKIIDIIENVDKIRLDQFRQEWFLNHREPMDAVDRMELPGGTYVIPAQAAVLAGPDAFPEATNMDTKMEDYNNFLRMKFGLDQGLYNPEQVAELENLIQNDPNNSVDAIRFNLENSIYQLGGNKRKHSRKHSRKHRRKHSRKYRRKHSRKYRY
jgi:uncharacterized protein YjbI with pentapeptide repeats